ALPDLLEAEFTAQMEQSLDQIAAGQQEWQHYLTAWNQTYFIPALALAQQAIPSHLTTHPIAYEAKGQQTKPTALSKTRCPDCQKPMAKITSSKVKKKYFLKCVSGCADVVLFWSEFSRQWEPPRQKTMESLRNTADALLTQHPCPVCKKLMEEYSYEKEGQPKKLLRCSDAKARSDRQHQDAVYFQTSQGWWNPKRGELATKEPTH
ncbi:MAG: DNA topoisomerase I, partial [Cyanobacteria bacterium CAN_BIN43]|nr:DNA topoisomerase I [Cyanobacteria bacterium CAN_BIN43]